MFVIIFLLLFASMRSIYYNLANKFVKEVRNMNINLGNLESKVRETIAKSMSIETEVLEFLAKDKCELVRKNVANNVRTPEIILE